MSSTPLRIALVGLGLVAQVVYLPILARRRDLFEIAAVCDLSPRLCDTIGERFRVSPERRFSALEQLLDAGDIDAVLLLTSGSHGAPALAVVQAGLPVLCEKQLCLTLAEADRLVDQPLLQLAYMKRFDPAFERAREIISDRGMPRSAEVVVLHPPIATQLEHAPGSVVVFDDPALLRRTTRSCSTPPSVPSPRPSAICTLISCSEAWFMISQ